jgi:hypothetical protein
MEATSASCTEAPPPHPALELPWFLELVAALLPARDVVNLSLASRRCPRLVTRIVPWMDQPTTSHITYDNPRAHSDGWFRAACIPRAHPTTPVAHTPHSMMFECFWRDQGWGNTKGTLLTGTPVTHPHDGPPPAPPHRLYV